jgi:hypothetical protein
MGWSGILMGVIASLVKENSIMVVLGYENARAQSQKH